MEQIRLAACAAAALAVSLSPTLSGPVRAETTIVLGGAMPARGPDSRALVSFAERVEADSDGSVTFEMSFDGQVVDFRSTLGAVGDELVDAAQLYPAFYRSELKVMNAFVDMGLSATESWAHTAAVAETVLLGCPSCEAEFEKYDIKPLALAGSASFMMICRSAIDGLSDLAGKSIRSVSRNQALVTELGANPVTTVPSEVFEAMQRGQVECVCSPLDWIPAYGLAEVTGYVIDTPLTHDSSRMPLVMNRNIWNDLSDEGRQAILKNLPFLSAEATANNIAEGEEGRRAAEAAGVEFGDGGPEYVKAVEAFRKGELDAVLASAKERGVDGAEEIVETYRRNHEKWAGIMAEIGDDRAKYEEALWTEIYSKLQ